MEIRIGIMNSQRELTFESNQTAAEIEAIVSKALESDAKFFKLTDEKERDFIIPVASLAYVEVGSETSRRVVASTIVWGVLTWVGVAHAEAWMWLVSLAAGLLVSLGGALYLPKHRAAVDAALFERLSDPRHAA